ncbi:hypothetical protein SCATT_47060 [Streptantibioticus cattleyicolor NRRL 8057 = DSM 46488]|uniref:Uncharacterized protein n=1 Tax=Streptantibioticus cattleyicolor (strain ATCC 35852 / DSM 46488 / JCM 4925 / NBRC 14057 / NRRL 8057) TaxID=1003195 RepID=G8WT54_STREN|nr:hypothetical protein SCATT_47060 [Streptantibioticus cattleyicolor NRRL 8057 = DSM 46488]
MSPWASGVAHRTTEGAVPSAAYTAPPELKGDQRRARRARPPAGDRAHRGPGTRLLGAPPGRPGRPLG